MPEPTVDGAKMMAKMTGLDKAEVLSIWEEVQRNQKRLAACTGPHEFNEDATPDREVFKKFRCHKCGGTVDVDARRWYERGLEHGRLSCPAS